MENRYSDESARSTRLTAVVATTPHICVTECERSTVACHLSVSNRRDQRRYVELMRSPSPVRIRMPGVISPSATDTWLTFRMLMAGLPCFPGWQRNGSTATSATVGGVAWLVMAEGRWTLRMTHRSSRRLYKNVSSKGIQVPTAERALLRTQADQCIHFFSFRFVPFGPWAF